MPGLSNTMKRIFPLLSALAFLSSCGQCSLTVQTDYLTHKDLASYYVGTPDPRQNVTAVGQRLIVSWVVPKSYLTYEDLHLKVTIRFRNREELIEIFHLSKTRGTYLYMLLNEDYFAKKGILTYKVDLIGGGFLLEEWRHRIWTNLISIDPENSLIQNSIENEAEEDLEEEYPVNWNDNEPF